MKIISNLINGILGIAELLLGFRFVFRLFAANPNTPFVQWIYEASDPVIYPFREIFPTRVVEPNHVFEFGILFAMVSYPIVAYLLLSLMRIVDREVYRMTHDTPPAPPRL